MNFKDPTGFIQGITRPVVTFAFTGAVIYLAIDGSLPADKVFEAALVTVGFWFGSRSNNTTDSVS